MKLGLFFFSGLGLLFLYNLKNEAEVEFVSPQTKPKDIKPSKIDSGLSLKQVENKQQSIKKRSSDTFQFDGRYSILELEELLVGHPEKALEILQELATLSNNSTKYLYRILKIDPGHLWALNELAKLYDKNTALIFYQDWLEKYPENQNVLYSYARYLNSQNEHVKASDVYQKLLSHTGKDSLLWEQLADQYRQLNAWDKSSDAYKQAIKNHSTSRANYYRLLEALVAQKKCRESYDLIQDLELDPWNADHKISFAKKIIIEYQSICESSV